jgi:hypothetical protein
MAAFEYCVVPYEWKDGDEVLKPSRWIGPLSRENNKRLLQGPLRIGAQILVFGRGRDRRHYYLRRPMQVNGLQWFLYDNFDDSNYAVIRPAGLIVLTVKCTPVLNGKDKVSALTLGGNCAYSREYGHMEECNIKEFKQEVRAANCCVWSSATELRLVKGTRILRGNVIVKKAASLAKIRMTKQRTLPEGYRQMGCYPIWRYFDPQYLYRKVLKARARQSEPL